MEHFGSRPRGLRRRDPSESEGFEVVFCSFDGISADAFVGVWNAPRRGEEQAMVSKKSTYFSSCAICTFFAGLTALAVWILANTPQNML
jgi:hypothetical protein